MGTLTCPELIVQEADDALSEWSQRVNEFSQKNKNITAVLRQATKIYCDLGIGDQEDEMEGDCDDDVFVPVDDEPRKSNKEYEEDIAFEKFCEGYTARGLVDNQQASKRIFSDLRQIWKVGPEFGFSVEPHPDNLYRWNVYFFNFEKDTTLYKDVLEYKKRTGKDRLEFVMDFPAEYPFKPPFIRAIRPRFAFHTGHITIGGSICMELLTTSGWTAANSVESILIQIRTEITAGGGQLDLKNTQDYTEHEAKAAFQRVAAHHKWVA
eukprot:NODE_953_length_1125_cov_293.919145_g658_i0.p1 GENE.NODE_953_length_1125_cov_293.919145_g658_i0~~NODE_953_length_1125_cov_293.919145_g658_i0.p1  ORF type:complete len:275 (+),score=107.05 NODE_953_length_1125_cov_293.919145_g658_i0:30-827(+)